MCTRDKRQGIYAKTLKYKASTGGGVFQARHNIEYPRDAILNSDSELIVTGDNAFDVINHQVELITLGIGINDDAPFTEDSHILLQKHKF